ncbi:MAG: arsenate reductase ArsC [Phycisphaerae bacterium]|jgi:arsenate reductase|nr:arsenate reductase ArsC [Phycisphaerae bacterium]
MTQNAPVKIAFICTGNSARSQMAEGLARAIGSDRLIVQSAGTRPMGVSRHAVTAMARIGIDITHQTSKGLDQIDNDLDYAITLCGHAEQHCPILPAKVRLHWPFPDPYDMFADDPEKGFIIVRDQLKEKIETFLEERELCK